MELKITKYNIFTGTKTPLPTDVLPPDRMRCVTTLYSLAFNLKHLPHEEVVAWMLFNAKACGISQHDIIVAAKSFAAYDEFDRRFRPPNRTKRARREHEQFRGEVERLATASLGEALMLADILFEAFADGADLSILFTLSDGRGPAVTPLHRDKVAAALGEVIGFLAFHAARRSLNV